MATRIANVEIRRDFDLGRVSELDPAEAERAARNGDLAGNKVYDDLRAMTWEDVAETLTAELAVVARLEGAEDPDEEYEAFESDRICEAGAEALWGLDPGVASATLALSALGAIPVASCNGGVLGGHHHEKHPLVAFYLGSALAGVVDAYAAGAGAGLIVDAQGIVQLYGRSCAVLLEFARIALADQG